jgi:hypothetical protein
MTRMHSGAVAFRGTIAHFTAQINGRAPESGRAHFISRINRWMPARWVPWGQLRRRKASDPVMSSVFNHRKPAANPGRVRGEVFIDAATRREIDSGQQPLWGQFLRAWEALVTAKRRYPTRAEIDPAALGAKLLPNVFLVDVIHASGAPSLRFRYRLLGQAIIDREPARAGVFLDEIGATADIAAIEEHYIRCLDGKVWIRNANLAWADPRSGYLRYRVMTLPLSDDGVTVTHLIGLALYEF